MSIHHQSEATRQRFGISRPRVTVAQLILRAVQRWQRNRAMATLERLDDRTLSDIGISRNEIPRAVEGLFRPKPHSAAPASSSVQRPAEAVREAA